MAQILIRNLKSKTVERLKQRARNSGRSLEAELREILDREAHMDLGAFRRRVLKIRSRLAGRCFSDSGALQAELRTR